MMNDDDDDDDWNVDNILHGKDVAVKMNRRSAIRRKNAPMNQAFKASYDNVLACEHLLNIYRNGGNLVTARMHNAITTSSSMNVPNCMPSMDRCIPYTNCSYYRVFSLYAQHLLTHSLKTRFPCKSSHHQLNHFNPSSTFVIDEDLKLAQIGFANNIPRVVSLGFNVLLEIIQDSFQSHPSICLRSLESLSSLLHGLKPESLKYESVDMLDKIFSLMSTLIAYSFACIGRKDTPAIPKLHNDYYHKIVQLSISIYLSLSVACGDATRVLECVRTLLMECNAITTATPSINNNNNDCIILDNRAAFHLVVPAILVFLRKNATYYLLGKHNIPQWCTHGFPQRALCETFTIDYDYHDHGPLKQAQCDSSITFHDDCLLLYRCNRFFLIGSGYNNTVRGMVMLSKQVSVLHAQHNQDSRCCLPGPWTGYVGGQLFFQPSSSHWASNKIVLMHPKTLEVKCHVSLIPYSTNNLMDSPFAGATICTTDGDHIILMTALHDDYFIIRELKPVNDPQEALTFSLSSEITVRLSSIIVMVCGKSTHNMFTIPTAVNDCNLLDSSGLFDLKHVWSVMSGKDFALLLTDQGKVYYTGSSLSLGIRHSFSFGKWSLLTMPKPVKIVQIGVGHEGGHALLLSDEGTVFFVGTAKRGEDGDSSLPHSAHRLNKPCRVKKFAKLSPNIVPEYVACNYGTSAIISKSGCLYVFGKDSRMLDTDANGKVSIDSQYKVCSIALGKAHALILTKTGQVLTCGFSYKGQCGLTSSTHSNTDDRDLKLRAHLFGYGKTQYCTTCFTCTEHGAKCAQLTQASMVCGCCDGNTGCVYCGVCQQCSLLAQHRQCRAHFNEQLVNVAHHFLPAASDADETLKMSSIPPTVLPLTLHESMAQVAAGLHHSVLLSHSGCVYTFGSNLYGQLGHGDVTNRCTPTKVKTELATRGKITQIAAGSNHTVLLTSLGEVLTFGHNNCKQLGRQEYSDCGLEHAWNTFPCKMDNIGASLGRLPSLIAASSDFCFIKYDEVLLSPNLLSSARLTVEKNNLILIPPPSSRTPDRQDKCSHDVCHEGDDNQHSQVFNNLGSNILIVSRMNGSCMILNHQHNSNKMLKTQVPLNFESCSSFIIDKFYHNLWTFKADLFCRYDLISLEASSKLDKIRTDQSIKFPCSWSTRINDFSTGKQFFDVASVLQPSLSLPMAECASLTKTPQQLGMEILCLLTSLTYSHVFGISITDAKLDHFSCLAQNLLPQDYVAVCRFEGFGNSWGYSQNSVEAIRFSVDGDIILGGLGLYGGRGEYTAQIKLFDIGFDGGDMEKDGDLITETDTIVYECLPKQKFHAFFDEPILIQANRWYVIWASINGPSSDCGSTGQALIYTPDQVIFTFKYSKLSNNGTDVNAGQIPVLLYKPAKHNDQVNTITKVSPFSVDDDSTPCLVSKHFTFRINSTSLKILCDLLKHAWHNLKAWLGGELIGDHDYASERLHNLSVQVDRQASMACFALELMRAYVHILFDNGTNANTNNRFDYGEYEALAVSLHALASQVGAILVEHDELVHYLIDATAQSGLDDAVVALLTITHNIVEECYQTYLSCCHAFYPSLNLKWSALCYHLDAGHNSGEKYILATILKAFCHASIKLVTFFPLDSKQSPESMYSDLSCHVVGKKLCDLFHYHHQAGQCSALKVFQDLLGLLVKPIKCFMECNGQSRPASSAQDDDQDCSPQAYCNAKHDHYTRGLIDASCHLMLKLVTELSVGAGAITDMDSGCELHSSLVFASNKEFSTLSRFCRRSATRSWDAGNGTPDSICLSVNKQTIYVSGVRVYACAGAQLKYQLQLYEQSLDESKNLKWKMITSVDGVCLLDEHGVLANKCCDCCDIRFDSPVYIQPDVKYAIVFRNMSGSTYSGDIGLPQIRANDDTMFNFMDSCMSKNGTNLNRGQIPHILYYNISADQLVKITSKNQAQPSKLNRGHYTENVIIFFRHTISQINQILWTLNHICKQNMNAQSRESMLSTLYKVLDSVLFNTFMSFFTLILNNLLSSMTSAQSYTLLCELRSSIPLVSELSNFMHECFKDGQCDKMTTSPYYLIVQCDHPYKPSSVTNYHVRFPPVVKWMMIEFDARCETAQKEDYVELCIPEDKYQLYFVDFNHLDQLGQSQSSNLKPRKFINIHKRFSRKNFNKTKSLFVPGNEMLIMLKTATSTTNDSDDQCFYGFRAQVIGYSAPFGRDSSVSMISSVRESILKLESELTLLANQCIKKMLNSSIETIMADMSQDERQDCLASRVASYPPLVEDITNLYSNHFSILHKSFNFQSKLTIEDLKQFKLPSTPINAFLQDFINLRPQSSGARLAYWFQNESFISPDSCLLNVIHTSDLCCERCLVHLQESHRSYRLCSQCYYRWFVKSKLLKAEQKVVSLGMAVLVTIITRDQYEEIAYDANSSIQVSVRLMSKLANTKKTDNGEQHYEIPVQSLIANVAYKPTIDGHDLVRYDCITMMKEFENYSLEELRCNAQALYDKPTTTHTMEMKSLGNGYYFVSWTPERAGSYVLELIIDGESSHNSFMLEVVHTNNVAHKSPACPRRSVHAIRKFVCNNSAGLRIRALPSLQSEQIGTLEVNGLLTVVDHLENEDGLWVRLSNESIQAYCSYMASEMYAHFKEAYLNDNFESNVNDLIACELGTFYAPAIRTEAWALEYNKHFNRTLLVTIASQHEQSDERQPQPDPFCIPSWFKVICPEGILVRSSPVEDEHDSTIIGMVPPDLQVQGVKCVQNRFGMWIRLSGETIKAVISSPCGMDKPADGWVLAQTHSGMAYVQMVNGKASHNKYLGDDDHNCLIQPRRALSNSAAKCIRALFAAFVWHEGILDDVVTAASYLKFNADITKEFIKALNVSNQDNKSGMESTSNTNNRKHNRNSKNHFRHSVEVSQLLSFWSSDINSNLDEQHDNRNNNNVEHLKEDHVLERVTENELVMVPEILINMLKLWDFISSQSLQLFTTFSSQVEARSRLTRQIRPDFDDLCTDNQNHTDSSSVPANNKDKCECGKDQAGREYRPITKLAYESIRTTRDLYRSIKSSVNYLLRLVPTNAASLTAINDSLIQDVGRFKLESRFGFKSLPQLCSGLKPGNYDHRLYGDKLVDAHENEPGVFERRRSFKFYRSISAGLSEAFASSDKPSTQKLVGGEIDAANKKLNTLPFLIKPSSRLVAVVHECSQAGECCPKHPSSLVEMHSALFHRDVFRFIFSCYDTSILTLVGESSICASYYRALALHSLDWMLLNVSGLVSLHDVLWTFATSISEIERKNAVDTKKDDCHLDARKEKPRSDLARHPFNGLVVAGDSAACCVNESLCHFIRSVSSLLPLLPAGSPLQQMAVKCFHLDFHARDHIFLHECKVFAHISSILTNMDLDHAVDEDGTCMYIESSRDITHRFELKTSSRAVMIPCLVDNSTETFWESGNDDRNKMKYILVGNMNNEQPPLESVVKFVAVYIDNQRDLEHKTIQLTFKMIEDKDNAFKLNEAPNFNIGCDNVQVFEVDPQFTGWIECPLERTHSHALCNASKFIRIEFSGPFSTIRVRQIKVLAMLDDPEAHPSRLIIGDNRKVVNLHGSALTQLANCEAETLQVFRRLTSQVFGKLLSSNETCKEKERRASSAGENDLREHMVGILFAQASKLTELQMQVCGHIVREIQAETTKLKQEWCTHGGQSGPGQWPDSYCFELLSLVLALSGSHVGCGHLAQQKQLLHDIVTLLHTSSDRVKRQTVLIMRRVLPCISVASFAQLVCSDQCSQSVLHLWLACVSKALVVQIKVKGEASRTSIRMCDVFGLNHSKAAWWLKGTVSNDIAQLIIGIIKDMKDGVFGQEWSQASRACITQTIVELTQLDKSVQTPEECSKTLAFWLALAGLCVIDEHDAHLLSHKTFLHKHDASPAKIFCDNHDDGETAANIECNTCGNLCTDCDRFLHLNPKTRSHRRHTFQEESDSIKVDIHEACGRVKLSWSLIIADAKQLKSMAEFRKTNTAREDDGDGGHPGASETGTCRFCGGGPLAWGSVCDSEECQAYAAQSCTRTLACGHACCGVAGELNCLPCLHANCASAQLNQDGDDMCMVCFSESLSAAPCLQLACRHIFHSHCVRAVLARRWVGGRITFTFAQCPICKVAIKHELLVDMLQPIEALYEDVRRKALMRLEYESMHRCEAITTPGAHFYNNPAGLAMEKYSYYLCFKCDKAYFGGEARCDLEYSNVDNFNPEELICGSCSNVSQAQICAKHGTDYLEYKCRYCCSVAVYFCFGSTHFCNACHDDFQRLVTLTEHAQCPVGPRGTALPGGECPLHIHHPPTGQEFALGCGICRNSHTF